MQKINFRDLKDRAKIWEHPVKGLLKCSQSIKEHDANILELSKPDRERYCVSLVGLALQKDSSLDWWVHMPDPDPPDGLVMTLKNEGGVAKSYIRGVEVVEHRDKPERVFETIRGKMVETNYESNTILVCLILTQAVYDLQKLASMLTPVKSSLKHVFVVFSGVSIDKCLSVEQIRTSYTMVQLLPIFKQITFNVQPYLEDYYKRYDMGQEGQIIEGGSIYFGTCNPKYAKK